jgi:hypothetical protein
VLIRRKSCGSRFIDKLQDLVSLRCLSRCEPDQFHSVDRIASDIWQLRMSFAQACGDAEESR